MINKKNYSFKKHLKIAPACLITWMTLGYITPAQATIVVDAGQQQVPGLMTNPNESVTININAASGGGISHNKFTQFDVTNHGVILNNSAEAVDTRLSGNIAGNSNISAAVAKLIINEVTSNSASQLNGIIEVAGKKADVIIANPAGISCDGCGFINAGRSTLTTGNLQFEQDKLIGINVTNGNIIITGKGMNDDSDYTSLLAGAGQVNAALRAKDIQVVTGESHNVININHQPETVTISAGKESSLLGLDVSALGGMYANKITLIGRQSGVGVSNSGLISADSELHISSQGVVRNSGKITSRTGDVSIVADSIDNTKGSITSGEDISLIGANQISNLDGLIDSGKNIFINSETTDNTSGAMSADLISIVSNRVINSDSNKYVSEDEKKGGLHAASGVHINTGDAFHNIAGVISATDGTVSIVTQRDLKLDHADISAQDINIFSEGVDRSVSGFAASKLNAVKDIYLDFNITGRFDASTEINAGHDLTITSNNPKRGSLLNYGTLSAGNNLNYTHQNILFNYGEIKATKDIIINTASLYNFKNIHSDGNTNVTTTNWIINHKGTISSGAKTTLQAPSFNNSQGEINATEGGDIFSNVYLNSGTVSELININPSNKL